VTIDEAKTKTCPLYSVGLVVAAAIVIERIPVAERDAAGKVLHNGAYCDADKCALWHETAPGQGHCGAAK